MVSHAIYRHAFKFYVSWVVDVEMSREIVNFMVSICMVFNGKIALFI